ncbi:MAG TPA: tetratricopeptide repeat protein [Humisphaera sp.]|jgi:tetratricopeptide (TPR) repeat protein|nr:tetratricopeptide repeat protein [Humisphaera sp.]
MDQPLTLQQAVDLANQHSDAGRLSEAESLYRQILGHDPNHSTALHGLGLIGHRTGHHAAGAELLARAVTLAPYIPQYRTNWAIALRSAGRADEALRVLQETVARFPQHVQGWRELGATLGVLNRPADAISAYEQALKLRAAQPAGPNEAAEREIDSRVHINIGAMLAAMNRFDDAITASERAIALAPSSAVAHMNRGHLLFRKGRLREAFAEYDWRWKIPDFTARWPTYPQPAWDGSDPRGKTILLWHEQGMGDTIHFVRYAPLVAQRGAKVIVLCQQPLATLLRTLDPQVQVITDEVPLPAFDLHLPLAGLPRVFQTERETIPFRDGYLRADVAKAAKWAERLQSSEDDAGNSRPLRVALVWAGSPGHLNDRNRSVTLESLKPILAAPNVRFFSMQKGDATAQLAPFPSIPDLGKDLIDFSDSAALLANIDLLITVDTAAAHLAGAMRRPVWTLVTFDPDFRWLCDQDRSCWYESLRLFRQPTPGDWPGAIAKVAEELKDLARSRANPVATASAERGPAKGVPDVVGSALADAGRRPVDSASAARLSSPKSEVAPPPIAQDRAARAANQPSPNSLLAAAQQHHTAGRLDQAMPLYQQALTLEPDNAGALHHLGLISHQRGFSEQALPMMERSVQIDPTQAPYFKNLATVSRSIGRHEDSLRWISKAIELTPADPMLHEEMGVTLERLDRLDEAIAAYRKAIDLLANAPLPPMLNDPNRRRIFEAKLHSNMGATLGRKSLYEEAMPYFEHAIKLNPDYGVAHMHRANVLFRRRDLPGAFAEYEWRFVAKGFPTPWRKYPQPVWDGSDLKGRRILLWPEQGMGDVIQFARLAPMLADMGAHVIVQCMPPLRRVLQTLGHGVQVIGEDPPPPFDVHLPLISVPRVLGTSYDTLPAPKKYLSADPQLAADWATRLAGPRGLRVGVVWSGSPSFADNRRRSIPLEKLIPLTRIKGVRWFSLQMGLAASQLVEFDRQRTIVDLSKQIGDFADSAAILANLDLLITTDTSIVHLSGALGVETWVMLWSERDFRWQLDDTRMPWYPSVRPFLQSSAGQWDDVVHTIERELRKRVLDRSPT